MISSAWWPLRRGSLAASTISGVGGIEVVERLDAAGLGEKSVDEAEVSAGDPDPGLESSSCTS